MRERIGSTDVSDEALHAFFDGELEGSDAEAVQRAIDQDPELRAELEELGLVRGFVRSGLERAAEGVPQARFEQIWDEIDRAIAAEDRLRVSTEERASIWTRLWASLRPLRWPAVAAAAAAVVAVIVAGGDPSDPNNDPKTASNPPPATEHTQPEVPEPTKPTTMSPPPTELAQAPDATEPAPDEAEFAPMPVPKAADVEIHNVELGGHNGGISSSGTVTVLYVEEDTEPGMTDSERSL